MHQHYLQHGHADTRAEVKNKGSSVFGLPLHLHSRVDGRVEGKHDQWLFSGNSSQHCSEHGHAKGRAEYPSFQHFK